MAPEPEVLKRKRSRPSDWWANGSIIASTPQRIAIPAPASPQDQPKPEAGPAKKRGRPSTGKLAERIVQDAPAAANRGRPAKKQRLEDDVQDENGVEDGLTNDKLIRRGRPSTRESELRAGAGPSKDVESTQTMKIKRGRKSAVEEGEDVSSRQPRPRKRGISAAAQVQQEEVPEEPPVHENAPKRRGRPSASRAGEFAEEIPILAEKPSRRGRLANKELENQAALQESGSGVAQRKKRGRRTAVEEVARDVNNQEPEGQKVPRKRGRQPVEIATQDEAEHPIVSVATRRRTRRSDADAPDQEMTNEESERGRPRARRSDVSTQESGLTAPRAPSEERGRRRTRLSDAHQPATTSEAMKTRRERAPKSSGQPQSTTVEVETASSRLTKAPSGSKKVGHTAPSKPAKVKAKNMNPTQSSSSNSKERAGPKTSRKSSKRTSDPEPPARKRKEKEIENPEATPKKRRRLEKEARQDEADIPEPENAEMLYQYLKPVSRKVSRQTIDAKWEPLPPTCVERVSQLLQDVQRPVVVRFNDEKKKHQAATVLQMVSRRLVSKISKGLPFPQATRNYREDDFDFEKILDHNRALEARLTLALHGNELLEAELAKETVWLEADKETLTELEKNAKGEAVTRNEAARKLHVLLQSDESLLENELSKDDVGMDDNSNHALPLDLFIEDDKNVQSLIKGLHGHVDTINGNMKQVGGIAEAIVKSKAAVQATLFGHLSDTQYGEVILGSD